MIQKYLRTNLNELSRIQKETKVRLRLAKANFEFEEAQMLDQELSIINDVLDHKIEVYVKGDEYRYAN